MAEIKVKKKNPVWLWLLIGFGVILLIFLLVYMNNGQDQREVAEYENAVNGSENVGTGSENAVAAYVAFVEENSGRMGEDHEYTSEAFMKLIDATEAQAAEIDFDIQIDIDKAQEHAQNIKDESSDTTHANSIRNAADILANALGNMQKTRYPGLEKEASELMSASSSIQPHVLTLNQKDAVKSYLTSAADLLSKMNNN